MTDITAINFIIFYGNVHDQKELQKINLVAEHCPKSN